MFTGQYKNLYHIVIILAIVGILLSNFGSIISPQVSFAQENLKAPGTIEEAKAIGEKILKGIPDAFKEAWQEALKFWQKIVNTLSNWWNSSVFPWLENIWQKILSFFGKEIKERKPVIEEEFQKEKEEMKEEIKEEVPKAGKSFWERFKELIK